MYIFESKQVDYDNNRIMVRLARAFNPESAGYRKFTTNVYSCPDLPRRSFVRPLERACRASAEAWRGGGRLICTASHLNLGSLVPLDLVERHTVGSCLNEWIGRMQFVPIWSIFL